MGEFSFGAPRCPATGEPCNFLEQQLKEASNPDYLRQTLGDACRSSRREAKQALVAEAIVCGLQYADTIEQERAAREAAKQAGVYNA